MRGVIQSIWRHPVKGFTPEPLGEARLAAGACFPCDRLYAVEDGPSGFEAEAPRHISKQKFTVLAKIPAVARIRTAYDEAAGVLTARLDEGPPIQATLTEPVGRAAFAAWLTEVLGEAVRGPLRVLPAPGAHRFMDDEAGFVSIVNLASVRDLEARIGRPVDPRRFRANFYVEGWPAWCENEASGWSVKLGAAAGKVSKPIVRCLATHVDPKTGERDIELVKALFDNYGKTFCGVYVSVERGGMARLGDTVDLAPDGALATPGESRDRTAA
jgi:uncharacterized protein YcbX